MMSNSISEVSGKANWNGVALAEAAEKDEAAMLREDGDGASTSSSGSSSVSVSVDVDGDGFPKSLLLQGDNDWQKDEKLLEELFRLKLTSSAAVSSASLPPKQRIKLYQPRTKLEQFEDILIESQLLEATLPEFEVAALAEAAGLSAADLDFDLMDGFDFEASDVIFNDGAASVEGIKDNDVKENTLQGELRFLGGLECKLCKSLIVSYKSKSRDSGHYPVYKPQALFMLNESCSMDLKSYFYQFWDSYNRLVRENFDYRNRSELKLVIKC